MKLTRILPAFSCLAIVCLIAASSGAIGDFVRADFTYETTGKEVFFKDDSIGLNIQSWYWDFGDRNYSTEKNPTHEYLGYGKYKVVLEVVSATGNISFKIRNITLERSEIVAPTLTLGEVFGFILLIGGGIGFLIARSHLRIPFGLAFLLGILSFLIIWS